MCDAAVILVIVQVLILSEHLVQIASTIDRIRTTRERRQKIVNRRRRVSAAASQQSSQTHESRASRVVADDESDTKATANEDQYQDQQMEVLKENSVLHNDLIQVRCVMLLCSGSLFLSPRSENLTTLDEYLTKVDDE